MIVGECMNACVITPWLQVLHLKRKKGWCASTSPGGCIFHLVLASEAVGGDHLPVVQGVGTFGGLFMNHCCLAFFRED